MKKLFVNTKTHETILHSMLLHVLGAFTFWDIKLRKMVQKAAAESNPTFLKELIWREFFMQILWHFPHTYKACFKPQYERIEWRNNEDDFQRWCEGKTGYPL